ncbi:MAG: hypothetical protein [Bacteriophage sp.]|nr:MAG: hypothetical protein [Bacteriophage sp.]
MATILTIALTQPNVYLPIIMTDTTTYGSPVLNTAKMYVAITVAGTVYTYDYVLTANGVRNLTPNLFLNGTTPLSAWPSVGTYDFTFTAYNRTDLDPPQLIATTIAAFTFQDVPTEVLDICDTPVCDTITFQDKTEYPTGSLTSGTTTLTITVSEVDYIFQFDFDDTTVNDIVSIPVSSFETVTEIPLTAYPEGWHAISVLIVNQDDTTLYSGDVRHLFACELNCNLAEAYLAGADCPCSTIKYAAINNSLFHLQMSRLLNLYGYTTQTDTAYTIANNWGTKAGCTC